MPLNRFKDIAGQEKAVTLLQKIVANGKIASSYMFTGPKGVGKTTAAIAFAMLLNCAKPVNSDGCGQCDSCKKLINNNHPDLMIVMPAIDKQTIGIDDIREIKRELAFAPSLGQRRIVIVDPAEKMTEEASNAFLKILEEPPPNNIIILNVREQGDLLPTIVSRCRKIPFKPLSNSNIVSILVKNQNIDEQKAKILARVSEGKPGKAVELSAGDFFADRDKWIGMLQNTVHSSTGELLDMAGEFLGTQKKATKKEMKNSKPFSMLGIWKTWYRDLLLVRLGSEPGLILNSDLTDRLDKISLLYTIDGLLNALEIIAKAENDLMHSKNYLFVIEKSLIELKKVANL